MYVELVNPVRINYLSIGVNYLSIGVNWKSKSLPWNKASFDTTQAKDREDNNLSFRHGDRSYYSDSKKQPPSLGAKSRLTASRETQNETDVKTHWKKHLKKLRRSTCRLCDWVSCSHGIDLSKPERDEVSIVLLSPTSFEARSFPVETSRGSGGRNSIIQGRND
jgi:hypothetical protein